MKRVFVLFVISILCLPRPALAQDSGSGAAAIAAKQEADERYKRIASDLQAVQSDNEALHAKISTLEQTVQTLRDAQAKPADNSGMQEELRRLAEKIQEVDRKRMEDKDAIAEEIRKSIGGLQKTLGDTSAPIHPPRIRPSSPTAPETPIADNGFSYTIQDGNTFGEILQAYNKDFKSKGLKPISLRQLKEANPNVDPARLKVGQKIIIPRPAGG